MKLIYLLAVIAVLLAGCSGETACGDDDTGTADDDDTVPGDDDTSSGDDDTGDDDDSGVGDDDSAGDDDVVEHVSSAQDYVQVAAGLHHACGLHGSGLAECWGLNDAGQASPPQIEFAKISSTCGITPRLVPSDDAEIHCWGDDAPDPPPGSFAQVDSEPGYCAINHEGRIYCWGDDEEMGVPPQGEFFQIDDGCGTATDGVLHCWWGSDEVLQPPDGVHVQVAGTWDTGSSGAWACAIRIDRTGVCWGDWNGLEGDPLSGGPFVQVDVSEQNVCWVRLDGEVECRGTYFEQGLDIGSPEGGDFYQIAMGRGFGCGVRTDGRIQCWGDQGSLPGSNEYGEMDPP